MKREIESLKGAIINKLQDEMENIGFFSTEHNIKAIIDAMASEKKHIMEEIVRKIEVLTGKVT